MILLKIVNECRVDYNYRHNRLSPLITETIISNEVMTIVVEDQLVVKKHSDKFSVSLYEVITYFVEITNMSNKSLKSITFKDDLPQGIKFINNSFYVNDTLLRGVNPANEIKLGTLNSKEQLNIHFKTVVDKILLLKTINNGCVAAFDFIYDIEKPPIKIPVYSNEVITEEKDDLYKQIIITDEIILPICKKYIQCIKLSRSKVKVIEVKQLNHCNMVNLNSILVLGSIKYKFTCFYGCQYRDLVFISGFSTILNVPEGINYFRKINAEIELEDTCHYFVDDKTLMVASTLLIKIKR